MKKEYSKNLLKLMFSQKGYVASTDYPHYEKMDVRTEFKDGFIHAFYDDGTCIMKSSVRADDVELYSDEYYEFRKMALMMLIRDIAKLVIFFDGEILPEKKMGQDLISKLGSAPAYWSFKPLTDNFFYNNGINYNDLNGDSGHFQIHSCIGIIDILSGEEGFSHNYQTELKTIHDFLELYKKLTGECFTVKSYE